MLQQPRAHELEEAWLDTGAGELADIARPTAGLAAVVIVDVVGPLLTRRALLKTGEAKTIREPLAGGGHRGGTSLSHYGPATTPHISGLERMV